MFEYQIKDVADDDVGHKKEQPNAAGAKSVGQTIKTARFRRATAWPEDRTTNQAIQGLSAPLSKCLDSDS